MYVVVDVLWAFDHPGANPPVKFNVTVVNIASLYGSKSNDNILFLDVVFINLFDIVQYRLYGSVIIFDKTSVFGLNIKFLFLSFDLVLVSIPALVSAIIVDS